MTRAKSGRTLSDFIKVRSHFQRSVNLERDSGSDLAAYYVPTSRAVETVRRWALAMNETDRPRAWSITGPYGSGKSSFALFLQALAGAKNSDVRRAAERSLALVDPEVMGMMSMGRDRLEASDTGFIRAVVTAQREPVAVTIMRALTAGARLQWPQRMPKAVAAALAGRSEARTSARHVVDALEALSERAPVLLIIDEFGKNLEAFAEGGAEADLFVLQEIAERISGSAGLPVFLFTLQHLAFADYASALAEQQRREWSKVQGRFEDVPFLDSPDQAMHILAGAFDHSSVPKPIVKSIDVWAKGLWASLKNLGLTDYFGPSWDRIAACYPLHPLAAIALPELSARYAQHSRTLFSFVAGREPASVSSFMEEAVFTEPLPVVTLEDLYGYFIDSAGSMIGASGEGSRWLEIERRLRETQGLTDEELGCLRTIAVLNLISSGGALRASLATITVTLASASKRIEPSRTIRMVKQLEKRGLVTYRRFADEFRIWQGSDFDATSALAEAKQRLGEQSAARVLEQVSAAAPIVAARHSQRTGVMRYFSVHFADNRTESVEVPPDADGILVYQLAPQLTAGLLKSLKRDPRPAVIVSSHSAAKIGDAALDVAAHQEVLSNAPALATDWVARRELQEREAGSRQHLSMVLRDGLLGGKGTRILAKTSERLTARGSLTRLVSDLCDRFYDLTPEVRNEMISRRELTSQGAKARRELLTAMAGNPGVERLGLTGFGPERAIYEAVLSWPGLHRATPQGSWAFQPPRKGSSWRAAWSVIERLLEAAKARRVSVSEIWAALMAPPVGLKEGPIPLIFSAAILHWNDEVAIFQDGTYQPAVDAALMERLVKAPDRFSIRAFGLAGARGEVVRAVARELGIEVKPSNKRRNSTVLSVMSPLLVRLRALPAYSLQTKRLSPQALAVREALRVGREPDQLLFEDLPLACGVKAFAASPGVSTARAADFAGRLRNALAELEAAYPSLLGDVHDSFARDFGVPSNLGVREDLRARASHLVGSVLEPTLRSALLMACDENLDNQDWLEAMAMSVGDRPPQEWRDEEVDQFHIRLRALGASLDRLEALHFERRADHREGFDARRVTVTAPNGSEVSRVVWIDQRMASAVGDVAAAALKEVDAKIGPDGRSALLSVLAEQLFGEEQSDAVPLPAKRTGGLGG